MHTHITVKGARVNNLKMCIRDRVYIDDEMKAKMEAYLAEYGAKA